MSETALHILGIRHHGPGSAWMVDRALDAIKPDCILIEGPPEAAEVLPLAASKDMIPPVALLVYDPEQPRDASYWPFAGFSPEWRAITWGLKKKAELRFIDLPWSQRATRNTEKPGTDESEENAKQPPAETPPREDPLDALAKAAGFEDGEAWWGRLIEERRDDHDPLALFEAVRLAMTAAREKLTRPDHDEPAREAHMRRSIRAAQKEGFQRIAVVCGAWHAPVLTTEALGQIKPKADDDLLKGLPKRKTAATWAPWTYDRLSFGSGYGAGVVSPGWYEHLWVHRTHTAERWMARVARLLRDEDLDCSPGHVIEGVRLAETLASLRGRSVAGLEELNEATLSVVCGGDALPLRLISRKLIVGERLGEIPDDAPAIPLARDLAKLQTSLRMKPSAEDKTLDLDQRKPGDLERSHLLHRLSILDIPWGKLQDAGRAKGSTFHEIWKLQWKPEFAVAVIEAGRFGNTVHEAAEGRIADRAAHATALAELTTLLTHVLLADLSRAVDTLIARIQSVSAVGADVAQLMDALPPLAQAARYGNVRKTDAALLEPVVAGVVARICAGMVPACATLDDDAAAAMRDRIDKVHSALSTLDRADLLEPWTAELRKVGDSAGGTASTHGLVTGRCWRLLLDGGHATVEEVTSRFALSLSRGNDPAKASAWLEGFLAGSGLVLVHDERLLAIVNTWVTDLTLEAFELVCPLVRRTFSTFEKPERRQIGERIKQGLSAPGTPPAAAAGDASYDADRAALVDPILRLILGEEAVQ